MMLLVFLFKLVNLLLNYGFNRNFILDNLIFVSSLDLEGLFWLIWGSFRVFNVWCKLVFIK